MTTVNLNVPVLAGGILNTNFFNGRVLAAEDLTAIQTANAQQHRQLGRATGDGVAWGLNVTLADNTNPAQPILHITSGLALNRKGEAVALGADIDLALVKSADVQNTNAGLFAECLPPQGTIPANLDCYILTASPASALQGSAPLTSPSSSGFASACASSYAAEGIQFGLLPLGISNTSDPATLRGKASQLYSTLKPQFVQLAGLTGTAANNLQAQIAPNLSLFRNIVAHLCFGTDKLAGLAANPFAAASGVSLLAEYGALDDLRDAGYLTDCAVPLALIYWTAAGVQFIDIWAARRTLISPSGSLLWPVFSGRRRLAEGLAMFLQFQTQIADLPGTLGAAAIGLVKATDYFRYLPPCGLIPIAGPKGSIGFDYLEFLFGRTYRNPVFLEGARLAELFQRCFLFPAIDLSDQEMLWLYRVRENQQAIDRSTTSSPQLFLAFTNGHTKFEGEARYDLNYWDYANFV